MITGSAKTPPVPTNTSGRRETSLVHFRVTCGIPKKYWDLKTVRWLAGWLPWDEAQGWADATSRSSASAWLAFGRDATKTYLQR
ncbi:hypothetical protein Pmani_003809 [Petrolisthes manimaculis]|uniref:Uncharacterized protein n=1 Tax=Petrolisthes manimaculis TaxID=1843537 RepID=A0AAE1QI31_9EUCA|nr:hypothetical protein Pmani_003809 [Petrolisthes manimaculis]